MQDQKTVLICDDSLFMRTTLKKLITDDFRFTVIGTAHDGLDAIEQSLALQPDIITMDLQMPNMNGSEAIKKILQQQPIPILVVSSIARPSHDVTLEALENGAIDFLLKPGNDLNDFKTNSALKNFQKDLMRKLNLCASAKVTIMRQSSQISPGSLPVFSKTEKTSGEKIILVGASTGGPQALNSFFTPFPVTFSYPIIVAQHMHGGFTRSLATRLGKRSTLRAKEAKDGETIRKGIIYVIPGECNTEIVIKGCPQFKMTRFQSGQLYKPSINRLFLSAVQSYGSNIRACLLTGMGDDGVEGMAAIKGSGGVNFVQSKASCAVFGMPEAAIKRGVHHQLCAPDKFYSALAATLA